MNDEPLSNEELKAKVESLEKDLDNANYQTGKLVIVKQRLEEENEKLRDEAIDAVAKYRSLMILKEDENDR